jgi:hypothetical protein
VTTLVKLDAEGPVKPRITTVEVNLVGAIYCECPLWVELAVTDVPCQLSTWQYIT